jgi:serine/threonine protein kinase
MSTSLVPPDEWPREVRDLYEPVRVIGRGGFASVWMARERGGPPPRVGGGADEGGDHHVAIKVMRNDAYAEREVAILSELSALARPNPNVVRLLRDFGADPGAGRAAGPSMDGGGGGGSPPGAVRCAVLSLERGPTINFILNEFGSLGLVIAKSISRQLIGAVAFLHGHAGEEACIASWFTFNSKCAFAPDRLLAIASYCARLLSVIHRDIQPCNIIVSGGAMDDDLWWSDELDVDGKASRMAKQCRITLVDFGFARALGPNDIDADIGLRKIADERSTTPPRYPNDGGGEVVGPCSIDQVLGFEGGQGVDADDSISRRRVFDLSEF